MKLTWKDFYLVILVTFVHILLVKSALALVTPEENISLMWLPDGYLLSILVIAHYRFWPFIILATGLSTLLLELYATDRSIFVISAFLLANFIEAVLGAYAFNKFSGGRAGLRNFQHLTYFLLFCVLIIPAFSAFIGAYTVYNSFSNTDFWAVYRTWISSASLGILFVSPLVLLLYKWWKLKSKVNIYDVKLFSLNLVFIFFIALLSVVLPIKFNMDSSYFIYLVLPFVFWSAIRFGLIGSVFTSSALVILLTVLTSNGLGPYSHLSGDISEAVFKLQVYLGTLIVSILYVAVAVDSLRDSKLRTKEISTKFQDLFNQSPVSLWDEDFSAVKSYIDGRLTQEQKDIQTWLDDMPEELDVCASKVNIRRVNESSLKLFGASSKEHLTDNLENIFTAESLKVFKEELIALYNGASQFKAEAEQKTITGEPIYTITSVNLILGSEVTWEQVIVSIEDITERRKLEIKLKEAAAVYASTSEGVVITDLKGNVLNVNQAFTEITGYQANEILNKNLNLLKSNNHENEFYSNMWIALNKDGFWRDEIWNRRKDGSIFPELLTINAIYNEKGEKTNYVAVFSDISKLKETENKLYYLANHDPLTGLPNRLLFKDRFKQAIKSADRTHKKIAIIFFDIDRFKVINDSLGHSSGDEVLINVSKKIKNVIRHKDTFARMSGDEFVLLLEDIGDVEFIAVVLDKIFQSFDEPIKVKNTQVRVSVSAGISIYPNDGKDMETLYRNADTAMYNAKESGRNSYSYYMAELNASAMEYIEIESALHFALKNNELFIVFQPQVELATGHIIGLEVLLRWQHPKRGLIPPSIFIPIAERSGLINEIGYWVLQRACEQGKDWLDNDVEFGRLAVNASGHQLQDDHFSSYVKDVLAQTKFPAKHLEIEVTETFVMKRLDSSVAQLELLRELGVEVSIDDFGTGYSSLSYLKKLPIDKLKIDQSFIKNITIDHDDMAIVKAILAMSRALNMVVIAEGVEAEEHARALKTLGCEQAQGYLYSKPLGKNDLESFLAASTNM